MKKENPSSFAWSGKTFQFQFYTPRFHLAYNKEKYSRRQIHLLFTTVFTTTFYNFNHWAAAIKILGFGVGFARFLDINGEYAYLLGVKRKNLLDVNK